MPFGKLILTEQFLRPKTT